MAFFTRVVGRHTAAAHHHANDERADETLADDPLLLERGGTSSTSSSRPSSPIAAVGGGGASSRRSSSGRPPRRPLPPNPAKVAWGIVKAGVQHLALLPSAADALGGGSPSTATTLVGVVLSSPQVRAGGIMDGRGGAPIVCPARSRLLAPIVHDGSLFPFTK